MVDTSFLSSICNMLYKKQMHLAKFCFLSIPSFRKDIKVERKRRIFFRKMKKFGKAGRIFLADGSFS